MSISQLDIVVRENLKTMREIPEKQWELVINIGQTRLTSQAVPAISRTENYLNDAFPMNSVTAMFMPSEVMNHILPAANKLEGTLITKDSRGTVRRTAKYRLVLIGAGDPKLTNNSDKSADIRELDRISLSAVTFQFIDHASFDLRLAQVGNIYNKTPALYALLDLLNQNKLSNEYGQADSVAAIEFAQGFVDTGKDIVIRDGTPLRSVSKLVQETYGIYPQGCACFLKDKVWYVFAPYSVVSEGELTKHQRLVIIKAPGNKYSNISTNIRTEGTVTTIIATGQAIHNNTSDTDALNIATGVMHADAKKLLGGASSDEGGMMSRAENYMTEYSAGQYRGRESNIALPNQAFVTNSSMYSTMLASKAGDIVEVVWERGDISKLTPGCAVTFITQDENRIRTLYGTLLGAASFSSIPDKGIVEKVHRENVSLTLFLKRTPRGQ